ncbi:MAG: N-acetyltransferase family protein [Minisyncoccales bacterium]
MKIRDAKKEDIEKIWEIEKESRIYHTKITKEKFQRLNKSKTDKKAESEFKKELEKDISKKNIVFLVAEISGEVIGWVSSTLGTWNWSDKPPEAIWINDIGVLKKYQKQGTATKLLKETEKLARKKGAKYAYLGVWAENKPAYNLYRKNNYEDFQIKLAKRL